MGQKSTNDVLFDCTLTEYCVVWYLQNTICTQLLFLGAKRGNVKERLGERIRRKRAENNLGLRETANKIGISPTYLSHIETMVEKTPPAEEVIRKLANLLNDDFDELMTLAGRVPQDVEKVIKADPTMPAFLRTAKKQNLSGEDLMNLLAEKNKGKR